MNKFDGYVAMACKEFLCEKDKEIHRSISFYLGRSDWTVKQVSGHCEIFVTKIGIEHFCYDGVLLITFTPTLCTNIPVCGPVGKSEMTLETEFERVYENRGR